MAKRKIKVYKRYRAGKRKGKGQSYWVNRGNSFKGRMIPPFSERSYMSGSPKKRRCYGTANTRFPYMGKTNYGSLAGTGGELNRTEKDFFESFKKQTMKTPRLERPVIKEKKARDLFEELGIDIV